MERENLMLELFNERRFTDVTFMIEEEEINVYKTILGAECSYFHTLLFEATSEAYATRITLNETPLKQFKEFIRFCYLKKVGMDGWSTEDVCNLLRLAHEYNHGLLLEEIAKGIRKQSMLNPVSLPVFHDIAVALDLKALIKVIQSYVGISVVESEEFVGYSADLVCLIFNRVLLKLSTVKALWKWKACHTDQEVEQVFKSIRWETVKTKIIAEVIRVLVPQTQLSKVAEPELSEEPEGGRLVRGMDEREMGWESWDDVDPHNGDIIWP